MAVATDPNRAALLSRYLELRKSLPPGSRLATFRGRRASLRQGVGAPAYGQITLTQPEPWGEGALTETLQALGPDTGALAYGIDLLQNLFGNRAPVPATAGATGDIAGLTSYAIEHFPALAARWLPGVEAIPTATGGLYAAGPLTSALGYVGPGLSIGTGLYDISQGRTGPGLFSIGAGGLQLGLGALQPSASALAAEAALAAGWEAAGAGAAAAGGAGGGGLTAGLAAAAANPAFWVPAAVYGLPLLGKTFLGGRGRSAGAKRRAEGRETTRALGVTAPFVAEVQAAATPEELWGVLRRWGSGTVGGTASVAVTTGKLQGDDWGFFGDPNPYYPVYGPQSLLSLSPSSLVARMQAGVAPSSLAGFNTSATAALQAKVRDLQATFGWQQLPSASYTAAPPPSPLIPETYDLSRVSF